jgi:hypothetical protein
MVSGVQASMLSRSKHRCVWEDQRVVFAVNFSVRLARTIHPAGAGRSINGVRKGGGLGNI